MNRMQDDQTRSKSFTRRALLLTGGKLGLMGVLGARLYYLQVIDSDRYTTLAEDNRISLRMLAPPRGRILDRFGVPLAVNQQNYRLLITAEQTRDLSRTLDSLAQIIPITPEDRERILREVRQRRAFVPITVRENLPWEDVSRIEVNAPDLAGVSIDVGQTRSYPYGGDLAHVLGYVGAVSEQELTGDPLLELPGFRVGKSNVERYHDEALRGSAGSMQVEVNALGRVMRELSRQEGTAGKDVQLTLDVGLQTYVQQRLMSERSASAVVMDIETGDILAMGSVPSFDPNAFSLGLSSAQWRELTTDPLHPLSNKALTGAYPPGSTFKMMVALAALEDGVGPSWSAFCPGHYQLGNHRFHCWKRGGHGRVDMQNAIKHSCDVYFYEVSRRLGIEKIAAMARRFGLGEPVGIDMPGERGGLIPSPEWKLQTIGEPWQQGETIVSSIGQGFILTTPLQLAVMTARIGNGGKAVTPRITRAVNKPGVPVEPAPPLEAPSLGIPEAHLAIVQEGMDAVVNDLRGTAYRRRIAVEGMEMAGKTGTSQVRRITLAERQAGLRRQEDLPWRYRHHALFVAFAPVHAPRYACSVVVEHGGSGSGTAAPLARDILLETQIRDPAGRDLIPQLAAGPAGSGSD